VGREPNKRRNDVSKNSVEGTEAQRAKSEGAASKNKEIYEFYYFLESVSYTYH
jgi:hypothetical protein